MLFSSDQSFGTFLSLLQRVQVFPVPLNSKRQSLQTSQQLTVYVICSTSKARIAQYALSSTSLVPAGGGGGRSPTVSQATFSPHLLFSFDFGAVFLSCQVQFPLHHVVQTRTARQQPLLLQLGEDLLNDCSQ